MTCSASNQATENCRRGRGSRLDPHQPIAHDFKFYLPSPFLVAIILVFVVLPLVWPESDDLDAYPGSPIVFDLAADVTSMAISADGELLAATCRDHPFWVWSQGQEVELGRDVASGTSPWRYTVVVLITRRDDSGGR